MAQAAITIIVIRAKLLRFNSPRPDQTRIIESNKQRAEPISSPARTEPLKLLGKVVRKKDIKLMILSQKYKISIRLSLRSSC